MSKRKGAGSVQSTSLLNFFSASSARLSATPAKDSGHSATLTPKVATSVVAGSSRETALVINDSSDDEVLDVESIRVSRPLKKLRAAGHMNLSSPNALPATVKQEMVSPNLANDFWIDEDDEVVVFDDDDVLEEGDPRLASGEDSTSFLYPAWSAVSDHKEVETTF
ncbi:hypothetical protein BS47DRAFT_1396683 [Hydnum rufescens UP504]|uniref:Uncharacterized protein n=1 Tax=Hydnum rufescens UP504 TaxID=1448309 RepID=A0A9P6DSK6_9AGAM|nr:hypothetical protein BS47DRAFT_1396683 [Hydnum rufescens UP504]